MAQTDLNFHATEPSATTPVEPATTIALQALKAGLGARGPAQFLALAGALKTLAGGILSAINDKSSQSRKLAENKTTLASTTIQTPTVKPPNLDGATQTINSNLAGISTPDTARIQKASSMASNVRSPGALKDFESKRIDQVSDRSNKESNELVSLLRSVNGFRKQVEST